MSHTQNTSACRPSPVWAGFVCFCRIGLVSGSFLSAALFSPGQDALLPLLEDLPAPLIEESDRDQISGDAEWIWNGFYAGRAVEAGFYQLAESFYRSGLESTGTTAGVRDAMRLGLATALIAQSQPKEAQDVLNSYEGERGPDWTLRQAAIDFLERRYEQLGQILRQLEPDDLPPSERAWYYFLRAGSRFAAGNQGRAENAIEGAIELATSEAEKSLFRIGQIQGELMSGNPTEETAAELLREIERTRGRPVEFIFTLQYASVLDALGRKPEALAVLQSQLARLPEGGSELRDKTLLLVGLIDGAENNAGRNAFEELLAQGQDVDFQKAALLRLSGAQPEGVEGGAGRLEVLIGRLLEQAPPHPLSDYLLLVRAELALRRRAFPETEAAAQALLSRFPGSELRTNALALLASSAWQRPRYRIAADAVTRIRASLENVAGSETTRAELAVLLGECYYRAGLNRGTPEDFRNAAEAYALAQSENPPGVERGALFFQRVLSLMRSGDLQEAMRLLNDAEKMGIGAESRWQAEWNLARFLQMNGRSQEAFRRVESLGDAVGVSPEIRLRFLWLVAQLSLNVEQPLGTIDRVTRILEYLESDDGRAIPEELRGEVSSNSSLLAAQALLETDNPSAGIEAMERLRSDFPGSRAAIYSYIVQARHLAAQNRLVDAQRLLIDLADDHRESEFAPQALYEAALQAIRRGQDAYLEEANQLLQRLRDDYPNDPLVFRALLEQGDIFRRLNQFSVAERIYELAENTYPNHPERIVAQLSLADTLRAQAASDPPKFEAAISRLEKLTDLPSAPADLRAEAGFKLGFSWQTQGRNDRASQVYWQVYTRLFSETSVAESLGPKGRFWVGKCLLELGQLEELAGRNNEARRWYETVVEHELPGEKVALGRLGRYQAVQ